MSSWSAKLNVRKTYVSAEVFSGKKNRKISFFVSFSALRTFWMVKARNAKEVWVGVSIHLLSKMLDDKNNASEWWLQIHNGEEWWLIIMNVDNDTLLCLIMLNHYKYTTMPIVSTPPPACLRSFSTLQLNPRNGNPLSEDWGVIKTLRTKSKQEIMISTNYTISSMSFKVGMIHKNPIQCQCQQATNIACATNLYIHIWNILH